MAGMTPTPKATRHRLRKPSCTRKSRAASSPGRGVASDDGVLEAAFNGSHGWFWRNRGDAPVTITLRTAGDYAQIKRVM